MADAYNVCAKNVEALRFLYVANRSKKVREQTLERVHESVEAWLNGYGSPPTGAAAGILNGLDRRSFIQELVPDLLRLSISCPFDDVRDKCKDILLDIKVRILNTAITTLKLLQSWIVGVKFMLQTSRWYCSQQRGLCPFLSLTSLLLYLLPCSFCDFLPFSPHPNLCFFFPLPLLANPVDKDLFYHWAKVENVILFVE